MKKLLVLLTLTFSSALAQNGTGSYLLISKSGSFISYHAILAPSTNRFYIQTAAGLEGTNRWKSIEQLPLLSPPQWATNSRQFNVGTAADKKLFYRLCNNINATNLVADTITTPPYTPPENEGPLEGDPPGPDSLMSSPDFMMEVLRELYKGTDLEALVPPTSLSSEY